jgi:hypothetical protein
MKALCRLWLLRAPPKTCLSANSPACLSQRSLKYAMLAFLENSGIKIH